MPRNPLSQLASLGEDVLDKASKNPTASRVLHGAMQLKDRVDDLSKRVRGLEQMEKRLAQVEKRLAKLEGKPARKPARRADDRRAEEVRRPAPLGAAAHLGHADAQRAGHDLEARRRRPDLLAVELDRQRLGRVDVDACAAHAPRPSDARRAGPCRASATSSRSRACATSPISTTSNRPSSGERVRRELHPAAVPEAVRDDHVVHRARAARRRRASTVTSVFSHSRKTRVSA